MKIFNLYGLLYFIKDSLLMIAIITRNLLCRHDCILEHIFLFQVACKERTTANGVKIASHCCFNCCVASEPCRQLRLDKLLNYTRYVFSKHMEKYNRFDDRISVKWLFIKVCILLFFTNCTNCVLGFTIFDECGTNNG